MVFLPTPGSNSNWKLLFLKYKIFGNAGEILPGSTGFTKESSHLNQHCFATLYTTAKECLLPRNSQFLTKDAGSVKNLVGETPTQAQRTYFSTQNHVNATTPPTFLVHANNDASVPVKNSILFNEALVKFKVPAEMHVYQSGGHGFGLKGTWFEMMKNWMGENKLL